MCTSAVKGPVLAALGILALAAALLGVSELLVIFAAGLIYVLIRHCRHGFSIAIAVASLFALVRLKVNSAWLVLGGAILGVVAQSAL